MSLVTEVRFAHTDGALADTLSALPGLDAVVVPETSTDPRGSVYFFRFDHESTTELRTVLAEDHTVETVTQLSGFVDEQVLGIEFTEATELLAPEVTTQGGFVLAARSASATGGLRGWRERWLLPDREAIQAVWHHARETDFEFEVLELREGGGVGETFPGSDALTDQQRRALQVAYDRGYFREPREASLAELAEALDLSASAVGGRLRRGMKSLVGQTLVADRAGE